MDDKVGAGRGKPWRSILTGHTHRQYPFRFGPPRLQLPNSVWEIRCPRTLQGPAQRKKRALAPGFWVHQIRPVNGKLNWSARLFVFDSGRFMWGKKADPWFAFDCP